MTPTEWTDHELPVFDAFDNVPALFRPGSLPGRDDLALCCLCLRWTTGDHDCRQGIRCGLQLALDRLEAGSQPV